MSRVRAHGRRSARMDTAALYFTTARDNTTTKKCLHTAAVATVAAPASASLPPRGGPSRPSSVATSRLTRRCSLCIDRNEFTGGNSSLAERVSALLKGSHSFFAQLFWLLSNPVAFAVLASDTLVTFPGDAAASSTLRGGRQLQGDEH